MNYKTVSINIVSKFWNKHPCNIKHSKSIFGTKKYFNEIEKRKYFVEPHIPQFTQFAKWKNKEVLEIGCGIGTDTINFARAGAFVTAVDVSKSSISIAKKRSQIFVLTKRIKFYHANAEQLSKTVPIKPYDLIYSFGVIHHTPNPKNVIKELKKYTYPKTELRIMLYHKYSWKVFWIILKYGNAAFWRINELISKYSEAAIGSPVSYVYTIPQAKELLKGFRITNIWIDHIFPYNINKYRKYIYQKTWYWTIIPKSIFKWLEKNFGWHILIKAIPLN